jgi:hypothetical protein
MGDFMKRMKWRKEWHEERMKNGKGMTSMSTEAAIKPF